GGADDAKDGDHRRRQAVDDQADAVGCRPAAGLRGEDAALGGEADHDQAGRAQRQRPDQADRGDEGGVPACEQGEDQRGERDQDGGDDERVHARPPSAAAGGARSAPWTGRLGRGC
ncbi:hypothetical protein RZS08_63205, partial [Arthrospira platensis SPKY1]|nr:hypothetical protein [Arthrospira platensis SPKY1]